MGRIHPLRSDTKIRQARAAKPARLPGALLSDASRIAPLWTGSVENRGFDVIAIGQNSLDRVGLSDRLPSAGGKARLREYAELPGGQIATAALGMARLGLRVAYASSVGDDSAAETVLAPLRRENVDIRDVKCVAGVPTQLAQILIDGRSGERTVFWHRDPGLILTPGDLDRDRIGSARALLIDAGDPDASLWAARVAKDAGVAVILDIDALGPEVDELLTLVDFPLVSQGFAELYSRDGSLLDGLEALSSRGACLAAITLGEYGAIARIGTRVIESPAFRVDVRDTTGAGDAFHAGFTWALLNGAGPDASLRAANAAAALNCCGFGAQGALPSRADLEGFLREREPLRWREPVDT